MKKGFLLVFFLTSLLGWSQREVSGLVKDAQGVPVMGVNVIIKGSQKGTSTDFDGKYKLQIESDKTILVFSALGMVTQEKTVGKARTLNVVMQEDLMEIDEVVITGYQKVEANKVAAAYTKIDVKNFERRGAADIVSGVEGLSSALVLSTNPSDPTGSKEFSIRGVSTLSGNTQPLIVLDGFQYEGRLNDINPYEVESITLLKDAASASIYGARSSNGVIVITTKKGKEGKMQVRYTNNISFTGKTDIEYVMNRVSSSDLVDIQLQYAQNNDAYVRNYRNLVETGDPDASSYAGATNRVFYLYGLQKYGYITQQELDNQLALLRTYDNTEDIKKLYLQTPFVNQHNISFSGGAEAFRYRSSLNYTNSKGSIRGNNMDRILFDFVSNIRFSPKITFDFQANLSTNNSKSNLIEYDSSNLAGSNNIFSISSYDRFFDANGNPLAVFMPDFNLSTDSGGLYGGKDPYEIQRLVSLGLLDETYYPALDFGKYTIVDKDWSARFQGLLNIQLADGLQGSFGGQFSRGAQTYEHLAASDSWYMRGLINNTTPLDYDGNTQNLNIPHGARFTQTRGETQNYLFRGQLEYTKSLGENHHLNAILGGEFQEIKVVSTQTDRFGYDVNSNLFLPIDYRRLSEDIINVYHPYGTISRGLQDTFSENFSESINRYVSAYSNLTYRYMDKYIFSASARMDQSNLFGTNPKYRYRPFWSLAGKWRMGEEEFMKGFDSKIDFRVSYGINGNIANEVGPFDIASKGFVTRVGNKLGLNITSYKLDDLRWEQTETINLGVDLGLIKNRLDLTFDYYRKNTTDILAGVEVDPTVGTLFIQRNDASIINDGYEIALTSTNITKNDFSWTTQLNYRYNKGRVTKATFDSESELAVSYAGRVLSLKDAEPRSLYVFDYAGVNDLGQGQIRKSDGTLVAVDNTVNPIYALEFDDLKSAGTTVPKHVASLNNNITYKGFGLSFLFIYQGGHVTLKDSYNGAVIGANISSVHSDARYAWKQAGDELSTDVPSISSATYSSIIRSSTKNVIPADFIRLRDVVLSYTIPTKFIEKTKIKELTFNLRGGNLWLWTKNNAGIDPETQGLGYRTAPLQKSYTLGVNLIF